MRIAPCYSPCHCFTDWRIELGELIRQVTGVAETAEVLAGVDDLVQPLALLVRVHRNLRLYRRRYE